MHAGRALGYISIGTNFTEMMTEILSNVEYKDEGYGGLSVLDDWFHEEAVIVQDTN